MSLLDCPVCLQMLDDPRTLIGCQHSICFNCIEILRGKWNVVKCPVCRATSTIPASGGLPKNLVVQAIVNEIKQKGKFVLCSADTPEVLASCSIQGCMKRAFLFGDSVLTMNDFWICSQEGCRRDTVCSTCLKKHHDGHNATTLHDSEFAQAKSNYPGLEKSIGVCRSLRKFRKEFIGCASDLHGALGRSLNNMKDISSKSWVLEEQSDFTFTALRSALFDDNSATSSPMQLSNAATTAITEELELMKSAQILGQDELFKLKEMTKYTVNTAEMVTRLISGTIRLDTFGDFSSTITSTITILVGRVIAHPNEITDATDDCVKILSAAWETNAARLLADKLPRLSHAQEKCLRLVFSACTNVTDVLLPVMNSFICQTSIDIETDSGNFCQEKLDQLEIACGMVCLMIDETNGKPCDGEKSAALALTSACHPLEDAIRFQRLSTATKRSIVCCACAVLQCVLRGCELGGNADYVCTHCRLSLWTKREMVGMINSSVTNTASATKAMKKRKKKSQPKDPNCSSANKTAIEPNVFYKRVITRKMETIRRAHVDLHMETVNHTANR